MLEQQLLPDLAVVLDADLSHVMKYLFPPRLQAWRERSERRRAQRQLARELRSRLRVRVRVEPGGGLDRVRVRVRQG